MTLGRGRPSMNVEGPVDWDSSTAGGIPGVGGSASFLVMTARTKGKR